MIIRHLFDKGLTNPNYGKCVACAAANRSYENAKAICDAVKKIGETVNISTYMGYDENILVKTLGNRNYDIFDLFLSLGVSPSQRNNAIIYLIKNSPMKSNRREIHIELLKKLLPSSTSKQQFFQHIEAHDDEINNLVSVDFILNAHGEGDAKDIIYNHLQRQGHKESEIKDIFDRLKKKADTEEAMRESKYSAQDGTTSNNKKSRNNKSKYTTKFDSGVTPNNNKKSRKRR